MRQSEAGLRDTDWRRMDDGGSVHGRYVYMCMNMYRVVVVDVEDRERGVG